MLIAYTLTGSLVLHFALLSIAHANPALLPKHPALSDVQKDVVEGSTNCRSSNLVTAKSARLLLADTIHYFINQKLSTDALNALAKLKECLKTDVPSSSFFPGTPVIPISPQKAGGASVSGDLMELPTDLFLSLPEAKTGSILAPVGSKELSPGIVWQPTQKTLERDLIQTSR
jgi:hypothetical protein